MNYLIIALAVAVPASIYFLVGAIFDVQELHSNYNIRKEIVRVQMERGCRDLILPAYQVTGFAGNQYPENVNTDASAWSNRMIAFYFGARSVTLIKTNSKITVPDC